MGVHQANVLFATPNKPVPARSRVKVAVRHTYIHHLAKSDIAVSMDVDQASGQECKKRKTENSK